MTELALTVVGTVNETNVRCLFFWRQTLEQSVTSGSKKHQQDLAAAQLHARRNGLFLTLILCSMLAAPVYVSHSPEPKPCTLNRLEPKHVFQQCQDPLHIHA
jgi:hypothetical protein